jgi:hypothetical protein
MDFKGYTKEIEKVIRQLTNFPFFLSSSDLKIIKAWYSKNIPLDLIKKAIYRELKNIPKHRRKDFSLERVNKHFEEMKSIYSKSFKHAEKTKKVVYSENVGISNKAIWKKLFNEYNLDFNENFSEDKLRKILINHIWKNILSLEERKVIEKEVLSEIKRNFNINNIDTKSVAKNLIAEKIKKLYNIP